MTRPALTALTPITEGPSGVRWKREDLFLPLGRGGQNGSKCRQAWWLLSRARDAGHREVVTGCSVLSPQGSMTAQIAERLGMRTTLVLGGTTPVSAVRHRNVALALAAGAELDVIRVGYNPALQRRVRDLETGRGAFRLCYGITTPEDAPPAEVAAFHEVGAVQVANLPGDTSTLVVPFGSGNSATSILYGLARHSPEELRRVVLMTIGPDKWTRTVQRLDTIREATGVDSLPELAARGVDVSRVDLHGSGFARYADRMPASRDGIVLHPTYEGKMVRWLDGRQPAWWSDPRGTVFWIVGAEARR